MSRPTRLLVDLDSIAHNFRFLARLSGGAERLIPVVKADAYGLGAVEVARQLVREGAGALAVAVVEEGIALRRGGLQAEILLLNFAEPRDAPLHRGMALVPALYDREQVRAFAEATGGFDPALPVHVKFDTGMGRLGFLPEQIPDLAECLRSARGLRVAGCFTNFATAEDPEDPSADRQAERMREMVAALKGAGVSPGLVHLANSAGILTARAPWADAARPGIALYGIAPDPHLQREEMRPAVRWEAEVCSVRRVPAGTPLGYGARYVTSRPSTIAVLPLGYHDGYRRSFSGRARVLLRGKAVPVVGAVSMDLTLVDATDTGARMGDRAVLLGVEGEQRVTAHDLAAAAGTIPYEILCGIGPRVPRVFRSGSGEDPR